MNVQVVGKQKITKNKDGEKKDYYIIHYLSGSNGNDNLLGYKSAYEFVNQQIYDSVGSLPFQAKLVFEKAFNGKAVISEIQSLNIQ